MARVLVIDDDAAISRLLHEVLVDEGHQVLMEVGEEALRLAREQQPDVILLDLMMPILDGFAINSRLQADLRTRFIPVVVMSASYRLREQHHRLGARGYLAKPFDLNDVLAWVERLAPPAGLRRAALDQSSTAPNSFDVGARY
jgi:CheY-like chemotaxis protein